MMGKLGGGWAWQVMRKLVGDRGVEMVAKRGY